MATDAGLKENQGALAPFRPYQQLATFAPSKNDILSTLEFFFGKPAQPEKLTDFSEHHAATCMPRPTHRPYILTQMPPTESACSYCADHFPDAYVGKNVYLRDTLNNLILSSPQDWQTNAALPWLKIEGVTVSWDEIHFDVRLLQRVPYEGASRAHAHAHAPTTKLACASCHASTRTPTYVVPCHTVRPLRRRRLRICD